MGLREHLVQCLLSQMSLQAAAGFTARALRLQGTAAKRLSGCRVLPLLPLGAESAAGQPFASRADKAVGARIVRTTEASGSVVET
jgi:hypothetical protein